jgi:hypothetical protein
MGGGATTETRPGLGSRSLETCRSSRQHVDVVRVAFYRGVPNSALVINHLTSKTTRERFTVATCIPGTDPFAARGENVDVVVEAHREIATDKELSVDAHVKFLSEFGTMGDRSVENEGQNRIGIESDSRFSEVGKAMSVRHSN